jgi:hypothetical protein
VKVCDISNQNLLTHILEVVYVDIFLKLFLSEKILSILRQVREYGMETYSVVHLVRLAFGVQDLRLGDCSLTYVGKDSSIDEHRQLVDCTSNYYVI